MDAGELPVAVQAIWWTVLLLTVFVLVPLTVLLLHRTLRAARSIRRYLREMLQAGEGVGRNTAAIAALDHTVQAAGGLVATAQSIQRSSAAAARVLAERAAAGERP